MIKKLFLFMFLILLPILSMGKDAVKGILDLREWTAESTTGLDGEWEFYWKQYLDPQDFLEIGPKHFISLPRTWGNYLLEEKKLDGYNGFATFRLQLLIPQEETIWAIRLSRIMSAYKVWINGKLYTQKGILGEDKPSEKPVYSNDFLTFSSEKRDSVEIVIQVSNFHYRKGGIKDRIVFGTYDQVVKDYNTSSSINYFLISLFLLTGFSNLFFYLTLKKKNYRSTSSLYLSLLGFGFACYVGFFYEYFGQSLGLSWEVDSKLRYLTYLLSTHFFIKYIDKSYPKLILTNYIKASFWFVALVSLFIIFSDSTFYYRTLAFYYPYLIVTLFYGVYAITRGVWKKKEGMRFIILSSCVLTATAVNDTLYIYSIINTGRYIKEGMIFFIFSNHVNEMVKFAQTLISLYTQEKKLQEQQEEVKKKEQEKEKTIQCLELEKKKRLQGEKEKEKLKKELIETKKVIDFAEKQRERKKEAKDLLAENVPLPLEMITRVIEIKQESCLIYFHKINGFFTIYFSFQEVAKSLDNFIRCQGKPKVIINTEINISIGKTQSGSFTIFFEGEEKGIHVTRNYANKVKKTFQEKSRIIENKK